MTKRVVIFRLGSLGDTIVALPCFHRIAASFPDHERIALTNIPVSTKAASLEAILRPGGFIHSSIAYPVGLRRARDLIDLARRLRALKAETLVYMGGGGWALGEILRDLAFFRLCGFKRVIGAPLRRDLRKNPGDKRTRIVEPEARRLARTLAELGPIDLDRRESWDLRLTEPELARARAVHRDLGGGDFIAVNTGGKVPAKDWGLSNWSALFRSLSDLTAPLVFVGAAEDRATAAALSALWRGPVLDLCGELTPRETGAVLARARLFIGHDSGPLHLAWTAGTPCVSLFGSHNVSNKWHPLGDQHVTLHNPLDVKDIPVAEVDAAVRLSLARPRDDRDGVSDVG